MFQPVNNTNLFLKKSRTFSDFFMVSLVLYEFTAKTIERINLVDDKLHAFLSVNDDAIDQARNIDKKIKSGENVGACYGMPISIKDNMCIKDTKTTCASKMPSASPTSKRPSASPTTKVPTPALRPTDNYLSQHKLYYYSKYWTVNDSPALLL